MADNIALLREIFPDGLPMDPESKTTISQTTSSEQA